MAVTNADGAAQVARGGNVGGTVSIEVNLSPGLRGEIISDSVQGA